MNISIRDLIKGKNAYKDYLNSKKIDDVTKDLLNKITIIDIMQDFLYYGYSFTSFLELRNDLLKVFTEEELKEIWVALRDVMGSDY